MNECLIQERCKDDSDEVLPSLQAPKSLPHSSAAWPPTQARKFTVEKAQQNLQLMFPDPVKVHDGSDGMSTR